MTSLTTFDAILKEAYGGLTLRGPWNPLLDRQPPATDPEPEYAAIERAAEESIAAAVAEADEYAATIAEPRGYTRSDLVRMRKVEQLRAGLDRGLK